MITTSIAIAALLVGFIAGFFVGGRHEKAVASQVSATAADVKAHVTAEVATVNSKVDAIKAAVKS